jgi:BlaI family transcriptional regulator, penicillinase repressor
MPRKPSTGFTDKELEIMQAIWDLGEATVKEIQEHLPGNQHYNSVLTIIRVLEKKGHLTHSEEGRAYIYRAKEHQDKSRHRAIGQVIKQIFGGSAMSLVLSLIETGELTKQDIDDIRKQLAAQEKAREKSHE